MPCLGLGRDRRAPFEAVEAACPRRRLRRLPVEEEAARMGPQDGSGSGPPLVRDSTNRKRCLRRWGIPSCSESEKAGLEDHCGTEVCVGCSGPLGDPTTRLEISVSNPASHWPRALLPNFRGGSQLPGGCSGSSEPRPFPGGGGCPWKPILPSPAWGHALIVRTLIRSPGFRWSIFPKVTI